MPDDKLSAALDGMRRRARQITDEHAADDCDRDGETCTGHDAELLLAAVDAVLADHKPRTDKPPPGRHYVICTGCARIWPCASVKAITRALTGDADA